MSLSVDLASPAHVLYSPVSGSGGGGGGGGGASGASYLFNTATSGDPGTGQILLNNATVASATALNISETDDDENGLSALIATWDNATGTVKGTLKIQDAADPTIFAVFDITGTLTDSGTYNTFSATHIASGGVFTDDMAVRVEFIRSGDAGATGVAGDPSLHAVIEVAVNKTYTIALYMNRAGTINSLVAKMTSGTLTANLRINGVSVTGISAVAVTSAESTTNASAANTFVIGDTIEVVVTAVASPVDFQVSILTS